MATYLELQNEIADDLARTDLYYQISGAVLAAIKLHETERFWFNETRDYTFSTVASQSDYEIVPTADIADFIKVDVVQLSTGGNDVREMSREDPLQIDFRLANFPSTGQPYSYAYYAQTFRFYPMPAQVYPCRIEGHFKAPALANNDDSNIWTNEGFELIRAAAKFDIYANKMKDTDQASIADNMRQITLNRMRHETSTRTQLGRVVPTYF